MDAHTSTFNPEKSSGFQYSLDQLEEKLKALGEIEKKIRMIEGKSFSVNLPELLLFISLSFSSFYILTLFVADSLKPLLGFAFISYVFLFFCLFISIRYFFLLLIKDKSSARRWSELDILLSKYNPVN